ncbi:MAG: AAA family ATPase [Flavobacterium piscis]|nr:AAA family ATPase [Flavobacterium piscis]
MDKKVVFAVAGSGKTKLIIDRLDTVKNSYIITYTISNHKNLQDRVVGKFGYFPENIKLYTYFSFIYSFCYKPFCHDIVKTKGINYTTQPSQFLKKETRGHYIDKGDRLFSSRISKFLIDFEIIGDIVERLNKYADNIFIDEIQDFASNDFNFILQLAKADAQLLYVGDFYQHTFDTSRDGATRKNLHADYLSYQKEFEKGNIAVDTLSLLKSWRCSKTICDYISKYLKIQIESNRSDTGIIKYVTDPAEIKSVFEDNRIIKLFYKMHYNYECYSKNWGDCKGEDHYYDVCVVLNETTFKKYLTGDMQNLAPSTKNKLYVAITRTKNNLYFVSEKLLKKKQ